MCGAPTVEHVHTVKPTTTSISMYASWKVVIPTIIDPFLKYTVAMLGKPLQVIDSLLLSCTAHCQEQNLTTVLCLFFDCT